MWTRKCRGIGVALFLAVYVGSYLGLSRRGYAEADKYGLPGFYYLTPEDSDAWRYANTGCVVAFGPLNFVDRSIGTGRGPGSEPMWGLAK